MEQFQARIQELVEQIKNKIASLLEQVDQSQWKKKLTVYYKAGREWSRIHFRRWTHLFHGAAAGNRAVGPISFLLVSAALGTALTLTTLYSTSYAVVVNGQQVGIVADQSVVDHAIATVESQGSKLLGYDYQVDAEVDYEFTLTLKSDLSDERSIQNYFYEQLNEVSDELRAYEVNVNGRAIGVVRDNNALNDMLDDAFSTGAAFDRNITDIISALTMNHPTVVNRFNDEDVAYYRHKDGYWNRRNENGTNAGMREKDSFANVFAIETGNYRISTNFVERWFPELSIALRQSVEGA